MNPTKLIISLLLLVVAANAHAWWNGPWSGFNNAWMETDGMFSMNISSRSESAHRYQQPYYKALPYRAVTPVSVLTSPTNTSSDKESASIRDAIEAQRKVAEQLANTQR